MFGRNNPCPCGSGKSYEHCCLASAATEEPPELASWRRIRRALDQPPLPARMIEFCSDESSGYELFPNDSWREFLCDDEIFINSPEFIPLAGLYTSWYFNFWSPTPGRHRLKDDSLFGVPPAEHFLERHPQLEPTVREYLRACLHSEFSFYEILVCIPGRGIICRDIFSSQVFEITRGGAFDELTPGLVLYYHLVPIEGITMIEAAGPFPVDGQTGEKLPDFLHQLDTELPEHSPVSDRSARLRWLYLMMVHGNSA